MMKDHCSRVAQETAEEVPDCPRDKDQFEKRKRKKQCEKSTRCGKATYHCVVNPFMNATIETCAPLAIIFDSKCAEINKGEKPIQSSSHQRAKCMECPDYYMSTEAFKYSECYDAVQRKNAGGDVIMGNGFNYINLIPICIGAVVVIVIVIAIIIWLRRRQANTSGENEEGRLASSEQNQAGQQNYNGQPFELRDVIPMENKATEAEPLGKIEGIQNGRFASPESHQLENSVQTNREYSEQKHGIVGHDDENAGVSDTDESYDDEENSERTPLLEKPKPQFGITRRRYMSESDACSFESKTNKERKKAILLKERRRTRSETDAENVEAHVKNLKNFP